MKNDRKWLRFLSIAGIVLIIAGYGLFQARRLLQGPVITITSPKNGSIIQNNSLLEIKGIAKNIKEISLNDRSIFIDEQGNFKEKLLLFPGYNIIKVEAKDKFGTNETKTLELIFRNS